MNEALKTPNAGQPENASPMFSGVAPGYVADGVTLYRADCLLVLPFLSGVDAVITDPPYGINANYQTLGTGKKEFDRGESWDAGKVDISPFLQVGAFHCFWGGNYYTDALPPVNSWLIWHKLNDGLSFSECEMAWTDFAKQTRHLSHHWSGEQKKHPTQKPIRVMTWTLQHLPEAAKVVLDPYMGSGTTGIACIRSGRKFIGIERDEKYFDIARNRIEKELAQGRLW